MKQYAGLWFPDDGTLTKNLRARLDQEATYRGDRLIEALEQVRDYSVAVDVGAHVGTWTRVLADRFEQVVAIEPCALNFECLEANTAHLFNVRRVHAAAGERSGTVYLSSRKTAMGSQVAEDGEPVPMIAVDELALERCGYLKVHVNGYEQQALLGAVALILRCRPVMTVVFKPKLADFQTGETRLRRWIEDHGYRQGRGQDPYKVFVPA